MTSSCRRSSPRSGRSNWTAPPCARLIAEELAAGIPLERIVVGGFSQGGALAIVLAAVLTAVAAGEGLDAEAIGGVQLVGLRSQPVAQSGDFVKLFRGME